MKWLILILLCSTSIASANHELEDRNLSAGQILYTNNCASCHGAKLEGQPNWQSPNSGLLTTSLICKANPSDRFRMVRQYVSHSQTTHPSHMASTYTATTFMKSMKKMPWVTYVTQRWLMLVRIAI